MGRSNGRHCLGQQILPSNHNRRAPSCFIRFLLAFRSRSGVDSGRFKRQWITTDMIRKIVACRSVVLVPGIVLLFAMRSSGVQGLSKPLPLMSITVTNPSVVELRGTGACDFKYVIEANTVLSTGKWVKVGTVATDCSGVFSYDYTNYLGNPRCFFRTVSAPHYVQDYIPPLGWNSWQQFSGGITEAWVMYVVQQAKTNGLAAWAAANGTRFLIGLDDFVIQGFDPVTHLPSCNPATFPHGLPWLFNYIHTNGFLVGIYLGGYAPTNPIYSQPYQGGVPVGYEEANAQYYASNHIDYIKYDAYANAAYLADFSYPAITNLYSSAKFIDALMRDSDWPVFVNAPDAPTAVSAHYLNSCRYIQFGSGITNIDGFHVGGDVLGPSTFLNEMYLLDAITNYPQYQGPWRFPDFDATPIGISILSDSFFKLRCMFGSEIQLSVIRSNAVYSLVTNNPALIAIDQDAGYQPPHWAGVNNGVYAYVRPLGSATSDYKALMLLNRNYTMPNPNFSYLYTTTNTTFFLTNAGYSPTQLVLVNNVGGEAGMYQDYASYGEILVTNSFSIPQLLGDTAAGGAVLATLQATNALPLPNSSNAVSLFNWKPFWATNVGPGNYENLQMQPYYTAPRQIGANGASYAQALYFDCTNAYLMYGIYGATNFSAVLGMDYFQMVRFADTNPCRFVIKVDGATAYDSGSINGSLNATNISIPLSGTSQMMSIWFATYGTKASGGDIGNPILTFRR
jgi:hypothetical protein